MTDQKPIPMASMDDNSVCRSSINNSSMLTDSYFGGLGSVTYIAIPQPQVKPNNNVGLVETNKLNLHANKQDVDLFSDKNGLQPTQKGCDQLLQDQRLQNKGDGSLIETKPVVTNINTTAEYNIWYKGLSILPWEDFVANPRKLNDLFYSERNENITYDPDEVNVFFHGKNVMAPVLGDVSENGKSWNIVVRTQKELSQIRRALTGRVSVFGVTLVYKEKGQSQLLRAPCLVMLDPSLDTLGDRLYATLTRAIDSMHNQRRFSVEINLNGCVQRWCKRVLLTECCAVGAKLVITSGEEYESLVTAENIVCCLFCFPVWLIQTAIYKLHRVSTYDDFEVRFDSDDLFLHGAFQDAVCQRQEIFQIPKEGDVFRTRAMTLNSHGDPPNRVSEMTAGQDNHKFVCIKKYQKNGEDGDGQIIEYETTTFQEIILRRKTKVLSKVKREKSHTKEEEKNPEILDSESTFVKTPYVEKQTDTNDSDGDESESDDNFQIPVIASSITEKQTLDKTEFTLEGSGSFFMKSQENLSPRLKQMHENKADASDTVLHTFREESSSDDSDESFSPEPEIDEAGKMRETEDVRKEILRISQTLPALKEDRYKSKNIEKVTADERKKEEEKATRKKGKDKKISVKKCIKDLMKTTEYREDMPELPSKNDARFAASVKPKYIRNLVTTEKDSNTSGNDKKNISEDAVHAMHNNAKTSSDSDKVEPTSQDRVTTDVENFDGNLIIDDKFDVINPSQERTNIDVLELDSEINESKRVFEEKENIDKVDIFISRMQDPPNRKYAYNEDGSREYTDTGDKVFQTNLEFKLQRDFTRDLIDKTLNDGLRDSDLPEASSIIPVGQTKRTQQMDTADPNQSKLEADLEICDSDGDMKEYIPTLTTQPSGKLIEIGRGPAVVGSFTRVRKGRSKYDSTRKYLGERVPKKRNK